MAFTCEEEARRVLEVLPKRFSCFGLTRHPQKTCPVGFRRPSSQGTKRPQGVRSFDRLSFAYYWSVLGKGDG